MALCLCNSYFYLIGTTRTALKKWLDWLSIENRVNLFSELYATLKLFLTIPVTNTSSERSFSKLSIVKSKLRTSMTQDRLEYLMLPFIELELAVNVDYKDIIEEFKVLIPGERRMLL